MKVKKTICLVMMVKNEEKIIKRALDRVKDKIDYWIIVDTGSTDKTMDIIRQEMKDIPGELHEIPWKNFGHNRTECLKLAKNKADYLLLCDADEQIIFHEDFDSSTLKKDAYLIRYIGDVDYSVVYLIRGSLNWKYVGVTHEYIDCDVDYEREIIKNITILDLKDGGSKADKYSRDIKLLTEGLIEEPTNSRYKFYLANSYRDIDDYENAAKWYKKRIEDKGWIEEVTCSYENLGLCYYRLDDKEKALFYWLEGYDYNPKRLECIYYAAKLLRETNKARLGYQLANIGSLIPYPENDILFVKRSFYEWQIYYELSICAYYVNDIKTGYEACKKVLYSNADKEHIDITINNMQYYISYIRHDTHEEIKKLAKFINEYLKLFPNEENKKNCEKIIESCIF